MSSRSSKVHRRNRIGPQPNSTCALCTPTATAAIEVLNRYLADGPPSPLAEQLAHSWQDVRAGTGMTRPFLAGLTTALGPTDGHNAAAA